jgi:uncharacterized protein YdgA (DUF945 family)
VNRATKILLAIGGIVLVSYPAAAWVTGLAIESRIQHSQQQVLDRLPYLVLLRREYHRGVYRSTQVATFALRYPLPRVASTAAANALLANAKFTVTSRIVHGPFPGLRAVGLATIDSTVSAPAAWQKILAGSLGSAPLLRIRSRVGLLGGSTAVVSSPPFTARLPGGARIDWGGLTGTGSASANQRRMSGQLNAPLLTMQDAQGAVRLTGLEYSGDYTQAFHDLYAGSGTLTLEGIRGSSTPTGKDFSLRRIALTSTSKAAGSYFDMRIDLTMDDARVAAVRLKNLVYSERFGHVDGATLASMAAALRQAQTQSGTTDPAQLAAGIQQALRQYGTELLLTDPVLQIRKLSFTMPEGSVLFSAKLSVPGVTRADLQWPALLGALKEHADLTADLRVDDGLVQKLIALKSSNAQLPAELSRLEQQGYLTAAAGSVATHLACEAGRLTLNGHPFPPGPPP